MNYFFLISAAFFLAEEDFGVLGAGVGILTLLTMAGNILQLRVTHKTAHARNATEAKEITLNNLRVILTSSILPFLFLSVFSTQIATLINSNRSSIIFLSMSAIALFASCVANGFTAGIQNLKLQARLGIYSALLKFIAGLILILIGAGSAGAISAYAIGYIFIVYGSLNNSSLPLPNSASDNSSEDTIKLNNNTLGLIIVYGLLVSPFVFDQLLIQHYSPALGGPYAALGIIGKLVFFLSAPILSVVYAHACSQKDPVEQLRLFKLGLLGISCIILSILLGWIIFGGILGKFIIPAHYSDILPQVFIFCLGISAYCISYLLTLLALVREQYFVSIALLPAVVTQFILFSLLHASIEQTVRNQTIVYSIQLICSISFLIFIKPRKKSST